MKFPLINDAALPVIYCFSLRGKTTKLFVIKNTRQKKLTFFHLPQNNLFCCDTKHEAKMRGLFIYIYLYHIAREND